MDGDDEKGVGGLYLHYFTSLTPSLLDLRRRRNLACQRILL